jgi:lipopolysaccharide transport system ATP-binding protein
MNALKGPFRRMAKGGGGKGRLNVGTFERSIVRPENHANRSADGEYIWALDGVNLEIKHGEAVGLIGRNGAGKSTLLKVLSRITKPTAGRAEIHGRVGSLLEVGTGFHPELTGRENIYLNGAILGMRKTEIDRKFDEIAAFAEVEKFLDTPVKHYSSGMYVRLAFAVAAHLEPEILLVDEVLAVGDASFQKKCLGRMSEVTRAGRTIVFVSHNMAAVANLCSRAFLLDGGQVAGQGSVPGVVQKYLESLGNETSQDLSERKDRYGRGRVRFTRVRFEDGQQNPVGQGVSGQPLVFALEYQALNGSPLLNCRVAVVVSDCYRQVMFNCTSELTNVGPVNLPPAGTVRCEVPSLPLSQSQYHVAVFLEVNQEIEDWVEVAAVLDVIDGDFYGTGRLYPEGWRGKGVLVPHHWSWN